MKKFIEGYLLVFFVLSLIYCLLVPIRYEGEADDYCLMTASVIHDQNISISPEDVIFAKKIFPEWTEALDAYKLSGYFSHAGNEYAWYFPTYSVLNVPLVLLLLLLRLPAVYAFPLTNVFIYCFMLYVAFWKLKINYVKKGILILSLTINPITFYFGWASAEVFITTLVGLCLINWVNKNYKTAAICISLAGTMNPTVLMVGIIMVMDFLIDLVPKESKKSLFLIIKTIIKEWKYIIAYGLCYLVGIIPFFFNLYISGHINLTASYSNFVTSETSTFERFLAYLFDLNYGILPYFCIFLFVFFILFILAILKRNWDYLKISLSFLGTIYAFSIMIHINSGMSGIARYNIWVAIIMVFVVCYYFDELIPLKTLGQKICPCILLAISIALSSAVLYIYGPMYAANTNYVSMTPIAKWVLNNAPSLYNPLTSTFCSRVCHVDGGYLYSLPIVYIDENGHVKKILANLDNYNELHNSLVGADAEDDEWIKAKLNDLTEKEKYISVPLQYTIFQYPSYSVGTDILFSTDQSDADKYVRMGISFNEQLFSWTDGKKFCMMFHIDDSENYDILHACFEVAHVNNGQQFVTVCINKEEIYSANIKNGDNLEFDFSVPESGFVNLQIDFPDAVSPVSMGISQDARLLGLAFVKATLE